MNRTTAIVLAVLAVLIAAVGAFYAGTAYDTTETVNEPQKPSQSVTETVVTIDCVDVWIGKTLPADYKTGDCEWSGLDEFETTCPDGSPAYWVESSGVDVFYGKPGKPTLEVTDDTDLLSLCD